VVLLAVDFAIVFGGGFEEFVAASAAKVRISTLFISNGRFTAFAGSYLSGKSCFG
jgi:hypothetical protein